MVDERPGGVEATSCSHPAPSIAALDYVLREIDLFAQHLGPVGLLRLSSTCQLLRETILAPAVLQAATGLLLVPQGGRRTMAAALRREAAIDLDRLRQVGPTQTLRASSFAVSPVAGLAAILSHDLRPTILRIVSPRCDLYQLPALPERASYITPNLLWSPTADVLLVGHGDQLQCTAFGAAGELRWQASCSNPDGCKAEQMRGMHSCHSINNTSFAWSSGGACLAQRLNGKLSTWHLDTQYHTLQAVPFVSASATTQLNLDHTWTHVFFKRDNNMIVARTPEGLQQRQHQGVRLTSHQRSAGAEAIWKTTASVDFPAGYEVDSLQFDTEEENLYCKTTQPSRSLFVAHLSQDGTRFCSLTFWQEEVKTNIHWPALRLAFRPIGTHVVVAGIEGVYLFAAGRLLQTLVENGNRPSHGYAPLWSQDGRLLMAAEARCLHLWEFESPYGGPSEHHTMPLAAGDFSFSPGSQVMGVAIDRLACENMASQCTYGAYDLRRGRLLCERRIKGEGLWCRGRLIWNPAQCALLFQNLKPNAIYMVSTLRPTADVVPCVLQPPLNDNKDLCHTLQWSVCGNYLYVVTAARRTDIQQLRTYTLDVGTVPAFDTAQVCPLQTLSNFNLIHSET